MAQHRGLTRKRFVDAVGNEVLRGYFAGRIHLPDITGELTEEVVSDIVSEQTPQVRGAIEEEFYCINDVADRAMDYLERACADYGIEFDPDWPRERLAMHLFVNHPLAFRTASDWYLWRTAANSMCHYQLIAKTPVISSADLATLRDEMERWFTKAKQGSSPDVADGAMCHVRYHQDGEDHIFVVSHGDYLHTQSIWKNGSVATTVFRPAKQDVLRFAPQNGILSLKLAGRSNGQRRHYIDAFGRCILGMDFVPEAAFESTTVSLEPIRNGTFTVFGNQQIKSITVLSAEISFPDIGAYVCVRSGDVLETTLRHLTDLQFMKGELKCAKLGFVLNYDGAPSRPVPIEVRPPQRTIISRKRDAEIIEAYLRDNKVLLG